jgi:hypothetical protein
LFKCIVGHCHAILIGCPTDRGSASHAISAFGVGLAQSATRLLPEPARRKFGSRPGSIPVGAIVETRRAWALPVAKELAVLFLRANTARHLVGICVGIGSKR